jgi:ppGpp synthetase/RelA/SpoT-type nucleotidyltranferase
MTPQELELARGIWVQERPRFEQLGIYMAGVLKAEIRRQGISAEVTSRPKEVDSLLRKLLLKGERTYDSLGDKLGVRAIVRHKDEVGLVLEISDKLFDLSNVENTADRLKADKVGYLSVHAVIKLRTGDARASEYPPEKFCAELQVRTLAQHLWAEISHDSFYKNDQTLRPVPDKLKRRIYILAGVVELADEEFNRIDREMPSVPELSVLKALERHHYKLTTRRGDPEISLDVIRLLTPLYNAEIRQIIAHLDEFYATHEGVLREVYLRAEAMPDRSAFLFQPEALMIYDLLESDQLNLRRVWNEHYPEKELERVANAFGISIE